MAEFEKGRESSANVKDLCNQSNLEQEKDNKYFQDVCKAAMKSGSELSGFPKSTELLAEDENKIAAAAYKVTDIEKALNHKTVGLSNPDSKALEKIFRDSSAAEREAFSKAYTGKTQKNLLDELGTKFEKGSDKYHLLKGLLLRSDSPNSMLAVELHHALKHIESMSNDIEKDTEGAVGGLSRSKPGGVVAVLDLAVSIAARGARRTENKSLGAHLKDMTPADVQEMKSEHMRMFRRDIGDMIENTKGLSKQAKQAFAEKGID